MENWAISTSTNTVGGVYCTPIITTGGASGGVTWVGGGGGGGWTPPPPAPQGPLDWLDAEVEKTCALARQG